MLVIAGLIGTKPASVTQPSDAARPADQQQSAETKRNGTKSQQSGTKGTAPSGAAVSQKKDKQNSAGDNRKSTNAKQAKDDDGIKWTDQWITILTAVLAAVALAQFIAAWLQAHWTRAAVKVAKDALTQLERAFVVFKTARSGDAYRDPSKAGADDVRDEQFIPIFVELENSGATPTRQLRAHVSFSEFGPNGLPKGFSYLDTDTGSDPTTFVIGPKATSSMSPFGINFAALERIRDGKTSGYLWGWVEYDDIFADTLRHRTEICMRIAKVTPPISSPTIQWSNHNDHNGMDQDCPRERWRTMKGGAFIEPRRPKLPRKLRLSPTTGEIEPG